MSVPCEYRCALLLHHPFIQARASKVVVPDYKVMRRPQTREINNEYVPAFFHVLHITRTGTRVEAF